MNKVVTRVYSSNLVKPKYYYFHLVVNVLMTQEISPQINFDKLRMQPNAKQHKTTH